MEALKAIQSLLRPTDTCVIVVQGNLLGATPPLERLIAVIKHEGTEEHALFVFEIDLHTSPASISLQSFYPIRGSFNVEVKAMEDALCQVLINNGLGSSLALQLDFDAHTAVFVNQIKKALHQFSQSGSSSKSSFSWLMGYQNCRTGWDRFAKPSSGEPSTSNSDFHGGFPDSWPWSHIITPNSDGSTELAQCEILRNFDPLFQSTTTTASMTTSSSVKTMPPPMTTLAPSRSSPSVVGLDAQHSPSHADVPDASTTNSSLDYTTTAAASSPRGSPRGSPRASAELSPGYRNSTFHASDDVNPFLTLSSPSKEDVKKMKHGSSDTNLHRLKAEVAFVPTVGGMDPYMTRSQEDLAGTGDGGSESPRHCVASAERGKKRGGGTGWLRSEGGREEEGMSNGWQQQQRTPEESGDESKDERLSKSLFFVTLNDSDLVSVSPPPSNRLQRHSESSAMKDQIVRSHLQGEEVGRSCSKEMSPVLGNKHNSPSLSRKHRLEFLNPSGIKPMTSRANMKSPELSRRGTRLNKSRDRSKSAAVGLVKGKKSQWVSRYRPGVPIPIPGETARESIMQSELRHREKEFCNSIKMRIYSTTWNVNGRVPPTSLDAFLQDFQVPAEGGKSSIPDIYAIGFQELDLSAQCLLQNESNREDMWVEAVEKTLRKIGVYTKLCCTRMVGVMLLVYIKRSLASLVTDVEVDQVGTGMLGYMGNKGGVGVHFNLYHSSFCFVNTHLCAHMEDVEKRNQEFKLLMDKMSFNVGEIYYDIIHHDMIFWLGDLNYRIWTTSEMTCEQVKAHADAFQFPALLKLDQLMIEMKKKNVFNDFNEDKITFKPTYKYDPNSDNWDTSEKHRAPAWCDRILTRGRGITQLTYSSHPILDISDHKPVSAIFDSIAREVVPMKEKEVLEMITWRLDKLENDTLPQVDLNVTEFKFRDVKFKVPQSRRLVVTNTGLRPVHISFIPKLDDEKLTKDWLIVKPTSAVIHPLEDLVIELTVMVNEDSAPPLTSRKESLEDILVLHLEKGKDFFITVSGNYLPSCFGSSLETLVNLHTYIREVPVDRLLDLTSSWDECLLEPPKQSSATASSLLMQEPPALDIPKELFAIVDFIERNGIDQDGLFRDQGRLSEVQEIMNMLDTGGKDLPGSVSSVSCVLLTFLAALAEPVVPTNLHQRCMECYSNTTLCKQILSQMPRVHKKTFVFMVFFMKKLATFSETNLLDPKIIASIFGEVLLRSPLKERKAKTKKHLTNMKKKKAAFLHQFIVNDLTPPS